ncbi:3'-5' exonuclease [Skermanella stibiiresistens]|uniref:3'-5' exonuclease n=1 Tax=Skermanella stibiiresistens TaxID=913326 RepID=UPI0004B625EE|nr:exonuclease domain-containing protein [Skermanella stibiiresistens]
MNGRRGLASLFVAAGGGAASLIILLAVALSQGDGVGNPMVTQTVAAVAIAVGAVFALWLLVDGKVLRPLLALAGETRVISHGTTAARVPPERYAGLAPLPQAINELGEKLAAARSDIDRAVESSTAVVQEQKSRLSTLLRDLHEGVLVCNHQHQILLYNQAALTLLHLTGDLGIGRNLLQVVTRAPVLHTLERLTLRVKAGRHLSHPMGVTAEFVAATTDGRYLLEGRMSLILQDDDVITGYVVTFDDVTAELAVLGKRDAVLRAATEGFRPPVANLLAAAETLSDNPDLDAASRRAFEQVILDECAALSRRLESVTDDYRSIITGAWPMSDVHTGNLINLVIARTTAAGGPTITLTGLPLWLHGDSYSLVVLLDHLVRRLGEVTGVGDFDLAAETDGRWVYIDITWSGTPVGSSTVDSWMDQPLPDALGGLTVSDALQHHRSELWCDAPRPGIARMRVPLPPTVELHGHSDRSAPSARPEFFDFSLLRQPIATTELGRTPLDQLTFVVFDTETTGLRPSDGDEIIQIAGVRIVNGRILTGETFSQLVDPGRPIPPETIQFHGVTNDMVRGKPKASVVLPQFHLFVSGAVLIAHNAAFDLKFLKMKEKVSGVKFDHPVLDTMLLSRQLQGQDADHTLDGIAKRLGIQVVDRHTALGDSLLTAAIFLSFVDMLREQNVVTLDDAIRSANILVELHARERAF